MGEGLQFFIIVNRNINLHLRKEDEMVNLRKLVFIAAFIMLVVFPASALAEPVTVNWWFAHGGRLGEKVQEIVANFKFHAKQIQGGRHL